MLKNKGISTSVSKKIIEFKEKNKGISTSVSKKIIEFKEKNKGVPTWKEIDLIDGVGVKTIEKLKNILSLE